MKNVIRLVGIIALMAAIMFSMTGCVEEDHPCPVCNGSGSCLSCHRTGLIGNVICQDCKGSGLCQNCKGSGQVGGGPSQGPIW
jgi:hypothetical protein